MKKITIAIADDHAIMRKGLVEIIGNEKNFEVIIDEPNGLQLLQKIDDAQFRPDLCILDVNMPVMNGYDTLIKLKGKFPDIKVLILSMLNHDFTILKMFRNGANGYLTKDSSPDELFIALNSIFQKGFYYSDQTGNNLLRLIQGSKETLPYTISENELIYLQYCCGELTNKEIADQMHTSVRTVEGYRNTLFEKLNLHSRTALAIFAIQTGIVSFKNVEDHTTTTSL
jgi:DNA-binding NarL/FixJ family response regulator